MRVADGSIVDCSRQEHPDLFWATIGGMGLTGHILDVSVKLESIPTPWIMQESERVPDIDHFLNSLTEAASSWPFTVGWVDCLKRGSSMGRGILMKGRWATPEEAPKHAPAVGLGPIVPFYFPNWALNNLSVAAFNEAYYWKHWQAKKSGVINPNPFFYPLDSIHQWNRIYGRAGFTQHQCVIPKAAGPNTVRKYMELLTKLGGASFLCVIKDCGPQGHGTLSFPMAGTSIALDLPIRPGNSGRHRYAQPLPTRRRWTRLPRERQLYSARGFPRHGASSREVSGSSCQVGPLKPLSKSTVRAPLR